MASLSLPPFEMATGTHWEWRAFGVPPLRLLLRSRHWERIAFFDELGGEQTDEYLWFPGMTGNVKIRDDCFKFKRLLRRERGFELWTEREDETFTFPLGDAAAEFVLAGLSCSPPGPVADWGADRETLKSALPRFDPPIYLAPVRKRRMQYRIQHAGHEFLLELAEVLEPRPAFSIALETGDLGGEDASEAEAALGRLARAVDRLDLPGNMRVAGYLQMLEHWSDVGAENWDGRPSRPRSPGRKA